MATLFDPTNPDGCGVAFSPNARSVVGGPVPQITSAASLTVTRGQGFTYQITTNLDGTANAPTGYGFAGPPDWTYAISATGLVTGTPK